MFFASPAQQYLSWMLCYDNVGNKQNLPLYWLNKVHVLFFANTTVPEGPRPQELAVAVEVELEEPPHCRGSLHNCSQVSLFKKLQHGGGTLHKRGWSARYPPNYPLQWASPWPAPSCAPSCAKPNGSSKLPPGAATPSPNAQEFPPHRRCFLYETIRTSLSNS